MFVFLSSDDFFQNPLFQKTLSGIRDEKSSSFDPDQARHFVESDLDPNCLQRY